MVNIRCYGRCYVKTLVPLCTFLKFHTHLEENLARTFQNVFDKCSRVLNLVFSRNWIFHENHHILGYHSSWREANQLAIYKRSRDVELGTTAKSASGQNGNLNSRPTDFKSGSLTTRSCCPPFYDDLWSFRSIPAKIHGGFPYSDELNSYSWLLFKQFLSIKRLGVVLLLPGRDVRSSVPVYTPGYRWTEPLNTMSPARVGTSTTRSRDECINQEAATHNTQYSLLLVFTWRH